MSDAKTNAQNDAEADATRPTPVQGSQAIRHQRVWLKSDAATLALLRAAEPQQGERLVTHVVNGCPFVARRSQDSDAAGLVHLGLRQPPESVPRSIGFSVPAHAVRQTAPASSARELLSTQNFLPSAWRDALDALERALATHGLETRLYGSLVWQFSTGNRYLTETSDIDLLLYPANAGQAEAALTILRTVAESINPRFDGECCLPDGRAVNWRELLGDTRQLLVKTDSGVALADRTSIWSDMTWQTTR